MTDLRLYQRGSALAIVLLLIIVLVIKWVTFSIWERKEDVVPDELAEFSAEMDSMNVAAKKVETVVLSAFDPNVADSIQFASLGMRPYLIRNILKYREKGGVFRKPSDLSRIYGMDVEQYALLESYIHIEMEKNNGELEKGRRGKETVRNEPSTVENESVQTVKEPMKSQILERIELNTADSATLVAVRGIGAYTARKILTYRELLGGFTNVKQIDEIEGLRAENLINLKSIVYADSSLVVPVSLNNATLKRLQRHPYISFVQARAIVELRQHRVNPIGWSDLATLEEFTAEELHRLHPYLCE